MIHKLHRVHFKLSRNHHVFRWNTKCLFFKLPTKRPDGTKEKMSQRDIWSVEKTHNKFYVP